MTREGKRERKRDPEATKNQIMDAAEELFVSKGFADVSVSEVARAAGVTKSLIHHHFGAKEDLWHEVKRRTFREYYEPQLTILSRPESDASLLKESLVSYFRFLAKRPAFVRMLSWMYLEKDDNCDDMVIELCSRGVQKISDSQEKGLIRADVDPQTIMISFLSLVEHWFTSKTMRCRAHLGWPPEGLSAEEVDEHYLDGMLKIFMEGIIARG